MAPEGRYMDNRTFLDTRSEQVQLGATGELPQQDAVGLGRDPGELQVQVLQPARPRGVGESAGTLVADRVPAEHQPLQPRPQRRVHQ